MDMEQSQLNYNPVHDIKLHDTVYALKVLGCRATCDHPSMFFCLRGAELQVVAIEPPNQYSKLWWYEVKNSNGATFFVTFGNITKMKHFDQNYSNFEKELDKKTMYELLGYQW